MFPYDAAPRAPVQATPESIAEVLQTLGTIETTCSDVDGVKWFNWLYVQVTQGIEARIDAARFGDPGWAATLGVQFGRLYFGALGAGLSGTTCPGCWKALFDCRSNTQIARIQFALAGINAHINHDLPEGIAATCQATNTVPQRASQQYSDYTSLNSIFDSLIEAAKQTLHVRLPGDPLPAVSHLEDTIAAWDVSAAREKAWTNAELLWHLRNVPPLTSGFHGFARRPRYSCRKGLTGSRALNLVGL
jgi:hypothetical protein